MGRVSFDFDLCLTREDVQEYCKELIDRGFTVFVTTLRYDEMRKHLWEGSGYPATNDDLWEIVDKLGIDHRHVVFTCLEPKSQHLKHSQVLFHLDDMWSVLDDLYVNTDIQGVNVTKDDWKEKCELLLNLQHV